MAKKKEAVCSKGINEKANEEIQQWLKSDECKTALRKAGEEANKISEGFRKAKEIDAVFLNRQATI